MPRLTTVQNGSDAWPWVTKTIRAVAIRTPRAWRSGAVARSATAASPRTTTSLLADVGDLRRAAGEQRRSERDERSHERGFTCAHASATSEPGSIGMCASRRVPPPGGLVTLQPPVEHREPVDQPAQAGAALDRRAALAVVGDDDHDLAAVAADAAPTALRVSA